MISKKTMVDFRDFISKYKTREIISMFYSFDINCDSKYEPGLCGKRKNLIEKYYHTLNLKEEENVDKIVKLYENILNDIELRMDANPFEVKKLKVWFKKLSLDLEKDGFKYKDKRLKHIKNITNKITERDIKRIFKDSIVRIFISHTSQYKKEALELKKCLARYFISSFVAHQDIEPTMEWLVEIEKALTAADVLIALLYKDFHDSKWTDQEIGFAMGSQKLIIPVIFDIDPYGLMGKYQAIYAKNLSYEELSTKILEILFKKDEIKNKSINKYVELFVNSDSFNTTKNIFEVFKVIEDMPKDLIVRIKKVYNKNNQIYKYFKAEEYMSRLLDKWEK